VSFPTLRNRYKNEIDLIDKILKVYSITQDRPLRNFERLILIYYIRSGYNKETKEFIKEDTGKKDGDIRVADVHLREKGYLSKHPKNLRLSNLSPDMNSIRESFIINKKEMYVLLFQKEQ
jgi:hypothetical protein